MHIGTQGKDPLNNWTVWIYSLAACKQHCVFACVCVCVCVCVVCVCVCGVCVCVCVCVCGVCVCVVCAPINDAMSKLRSKSIWIISNVYCVESLPSTPTHAFRTIVLSMYAVQWQFSCLLTCNLWWSLYFTQPSYPLNPFHVLPCPPMSFHWPTGWINFLCLKYSDALPCFLRQGPCGCTHQNHAYLPPLRLKNETRWSASYYAYLAAGKRRLYYHPLPSTHTHTHTHTRLRSKYVHLMSSCDGSHWRCQAV